MRYRVQPMPNCENAPHNASVVAIFELIRAFDDILLAQTFHDDISKDSRVIVLINTLTNIHTDGRTVLQTTPTHVATLLVRGSMIMICEPCRSRPILKV